MSLNLLRQVIDDLSLDQLCHMAKICKPKKGKARLTAVTHWNYNSEYLKTKMKHCLGLRNWRTSSWNSCHLIPLGGGGGKKRWKKHPGEGSLDAHLQHSMLLNKKLQCFNSFQDHLQEIAILVVIEVMTKQIAHKTNEGGMIQQTIRAPPNKAFNYWPVSNPTYKQPQYGSCLYPTARNSNQTVDHWHQATWKAASDRATLYRHEYKSVGCACNWHHSKRTQAMSVCTS